MMSLFTFCQNFHLHFKTSSKSHFKSRTNSCFKLKFFYFFFFCFFCKAEVSEDVDRALLLLDEIKIILKGIVSSANAEESQFFQALDFVKKQDYDAALKIFGCFVKREGDRKIHSLYWIMHCWICKKRYEKAITAGLMFLQEIKNVQMYDELLIMRKMVYKYLAESYRQIGRLEDAQAMEELLQAQYPDDAIARAG